MNRIHNISINNYRSCINTDFPLYRPLSALIGINGVGKTNILSAIANLSSIGTHINNQERLSKNLESDSASISLQLSMDDALYDVRALFVLEFDEYKEKIRYTKLEYKKTNASKWIAIGEEYFRYAEFYFDKTQPEFSATIKNSIISDPVKMVEQKYGIISILMDVAYFSATRFADPTKSSTSIELKERGMPARLNRFNHHDSFLRDLYDASLGDGSFDKFLNIVGPGGLGLVDHIAFETINIPSTTYKVLVGGRYQNKESVRKLVVPSVIVDGLNLSFSQLSEGTFKTLALVFYILNSNQQILLVEEPEVCVHHGLLTSIIELIKVESNTKQIIISTHSDYVLSMLDPENIVMVTKSKETGTIAKPLDKAMQEDDYKYLKTYLNESGNLGEYWRESGFTNE